MDQLSAVNSLGCVKVLTNSYSVPLQAGTQVQAKVYARFVELWHEGRWGRHERCYRRHQQVLESGTLPRCALTESQVPRPARVPWSSNAGLALWPDSFDPSGSP